MKSKVSSLSINDNDTEECIVNVYNKYGYTIDPHTAVGYLGLKKYIKNNNIINYTGIVLATAHPSKFLNV